MTLWKQVAIVQRRLTDYRVPLFRGLRDVLAAENVELRLLHGAGTSQELAKNDSGTLSWAEPLETRYLLGGRLCWQPFRALTRDADLVVITQENWMIANHLALIQPGRRKLAFWGHGGNFQSLKYNWRDRYKAWTSRQVDWWFAYTSLSQKRVVEAGFPSERITCLNNAIDTENLTTDLTAASEVPRAYILEKYGLNEGRFGIFIGSLYPAKRVDFLLQAAHLIRAVVKDFQLLIVGAGPDEAALRAAASGLDWVRFLGGRRGAEKAELLRIGEVILNPGLVGLGIFDALCAGLPLLTTDCGIHSPEIAYLNDELGVITEDDLEAFAATAIDTLTQPFLRRTAALQGPRVVEELGLDNMIDNFAVGILRALER